MSQPATTPDPRFGLAVPERRYVVWQLRCGTWRPMASFTTLAEALAWRHSQGGTVQRMGERPECSVA